MKIIQIVPGSGGTFYCENCLRDNTLVKRLRHHGHDVMMVPMYLPMFADDANLSGDVPVFFGGINVYLQQVLPLFRRTPRWLDRLFDARWLLRATARYAGSTRARGLGEMTLSMLRGEEGNQVKEVARLVAWLREQPPPDAIHLSNALLIGLARPLREALGAPIACSLEDEDTWVDAMPARDAQRCWDAMREKAADVDAFLAVSRYYAGVMGPRLGIPPGRMHVVHPGTEPEGHQAAPLSFDPPIIGFLSRLSRSQGLDRLVDAFLALRREPGLAGLRLAVTGGMTGDDRAFVAHLQRRLAREGASGAVTFVAEFDRVNRLRFLQSLSVLCVPVPRGEAFGMFVVEAMASGVPVVEPRCAAFPELVEPSGAGVLYDPADADGLVKALRGVLRDPPRAREMGRQGRRAFLDGFTVEHSAQAMVGVYDEAIRTKNTARP